MISFLINQSCSVVVQVSWVMHEISNQTFYEMKNVTQSHRIAKKYFFTGRLNNDFAVFKTFLIKLDCDFLFDAIPSFLFFPVLLPTH